MGRLNRPERREASTLCSTTMANDEKHESWRFLGIEFAPLNVQRERRIQTMIGAIYLSFLYFFSGIIGLTVVGWILCTRYWYISAAYICHVIYYNIYYLKDSQIRSEWVRNWMVYRLAYDYFPVKLHKTCELDPKRSYLAGFHPHGVMPNGAVLTIASNTSIFVKTFPGLTPVLCALDFMFWMPLYREIVLLNGVRTVHRTALRNLLPVAGNFVVIVIGGATESLEGDPGHYSLIVKNRKGFIREAIISGSDLVPIFSFGENFCFPLVHQRPGSWGRRVQDAFKRIFSITLPFIRGRGIFQYSFGVIPHRHKIDVVIGAPIPVTRNAVPSREEIDAMHDKYITALVDLFEKYKGKFEPHATLAFR